MNIDPKRFLIKKQLNTHLQSLDKAIVSLNFSYQKCQSIDLNHEFTETELETLEAYIHQKLGELPE